MIFNKYKILVAISSGILFVTTLGCSSEFSEDVFAGDPDEMIFQAQVGISDGVKTRANTSVTDVANGSKNSTTGVYYYGFGDLNFHFLIEGADKNGEPGTKKSDYITNPPYKGTLVPAENEPVIKWLSRKPEHKIWSWTTPWNDSDWTDKSQEERTPEEYYEITFEDTSITETTGSAASNFVESSWANGRNLERFVTAAAGPFSYELNGQYVPILYQHQVAKILLGAFSVIDNSTSTSNTELKGNITIYGLPRTFKFYPTPTEKDENGKDIPVRGYIDTSDYGYLDDGVTFAITNYNRYVYTDGGSSISNPVRTGNIDYFKDVWYLPPDVDLRDLSFKIDIYEWVNGQWQINKKYGENGGYYGDFSTIKLSRTEGSNYDTGDDFYTLHASEYLILAINLSTNGNAGVSGIVANWNDTYHDRSAAKHPKDGIYSIKDAKDFSSVMNSKDPETIEEYFEVYGSGEFTEDGEGIFKLYEDIGTPNTPQYNWADQKMSRLDVADGYILDGLGHIVEMGTTTPQVGNIRNIYLRYWISGRDTTTGITSHTINMIYVDDNGGVWLVDGFTLEKTPTQYNVNDVNKNPFTIDLRTGRVY